MADHESPQSPPQDAPRELPTATPTAAFDAPGDRGNNLTISFQRVPVPAEQTDLWRAIRLHTEQIGFNQFDSFVHDALCKNPEPEPAELKEFKRLAGSQLELRRTGPRSCSLGDFARFIPGADLYGVLKLTAELFLLLRCGICRPTESLDSILSSAGSQNRPDNAFHLGDAATEPLDIHALNERLTRFLGSDPAGYVKKILDNLFGTENVKTSPFCPVSAGFGPCLIELIWSYWHEQGMLVQTANAIALRFQNVARRNGRDPLTEFELDPLRPLSGFIWGYVRDEPARLSVARRAYEYHHEYGLGLSGRAAARIRPADSRSKFLQAFHDLLRLTDQFYREASDNTVTPDPFPLLIALRDLHMILAEGAHNQFRDLPWTARSEMLVQQWLLARDETRDFLRGRFMTPYPEGWMGAVDAMKRLQGWTDTSVIHFSDLAKFGERLLLSVRHVRWDAISDPTAAQGWALEWRPEVQGYIHAYRMATGVSLADDVVEMNSPDAPRYLQPSVLLRTRQLQQARPAALPQPAAARRIVPPPRRRALPRP
jgi:hypothetical protein